MRCDFCRRTFKPKFPSIDGTCFGIGVLGHILEYAGKKNTDEDIAYYLRILNRYKRWATTGWNARKALAYTTVRKFVMVAAHTPRRRVITNFVISV